jgi:hypothetical protein
MGGSGEGTLRAKYLDWCSARLAERFLDLSPEEIYALARPDVVDAVEAAAPEPGTSGARVSEVGGVGGPVETGGAERISAEPGRRRLPHPTEEGYRVLVQRVTEVLLRRTSLPTFDQWAAAYAESPARFDAELLGFWKDAVSGPDAGSTGEGSDGGP